MITNKYAKKTTYISGFLHFYTKNVFNYQKHGILKDFSITSESKKNYMK